MPSTEEQLREKLETLDGSRGKAALRKRAVRIEDLAPLLEIPQLQAPAAACATPTASEYAALLKDVSTVHARLSEIAELLRDKIL